MAADERTDEPARETAASSSTFRRRGLIAGAAALVAGALAKQAATPVSAYDSTHTFQSVVGVNYGPDGNADGVQGYAAGANTAGVFGRNNDLNGVGAFGIASNGTGVFGQSQGGSGVAGNSGSGQGVGGQSTSNTGVSGYSTSGVGVQGKSASNVGVFGISADNSAPAIQRLSNGNSIAVNGLARGDNTGVVGQGNTGSGVAGYTSSTTYAAVVGNGNANVSGVQGYTNSTTYAAVTGNTTASPGVYGQSNSAIGVFGYSGTSNGVYGTSDSGTAIFGYAPNTATGVDGNSVHGTGVSGESGSGVAVSGVSATSYGLYGSSTSSHGVVGTSAGSGTAGINGYTSGSNAFAALFTGPVSITGGAVSVYNGTQTNIPAQNANTHGIVAYAQSSGYGAVYGVANAAGSVGIYGDTIAGAYAGYFHGALAVTGAKAAVVPHPDGTHRTLYCMESPESWFEDFGEGALAAGTATVALDVDFAAVVDTSKLHVFLTSHVAGNALAVTARSATGFTVTEGNGGKSAGGFTYRVVAKRKDIAAPRLAKVALVSLPAPVVPTVPTASPTPTPPPPTKTPIPMLPPIPKLPPPPGIVPSVAAEITGGPPAPSGTATPAAPTTVQPASR